jgi:signal transduction histidine kinase
VQDLEELSRVEAGAFQLRLTTVPLAQLARAVADRLGRQFEEKGVALELDVPADLPPLTCDESRMGQVLLNVVGNALHYTPPGGRVRLTASAGPCTAPAPSGPGSSAPHDYVCLSVADTGIGIASEHLPHLFTRFYRVDKSRSRAGGGSGIGLTIARHLVEAHGGRIWAASPGLGQGSTFHVSLPTGGPSLRQED